MKSKARAFWRFIVWGPLPEGVSKGIVRPTTKTAPKNPPPKTPRASIDRLTTDYDKSFKVSLQEIEDAIRQIRDCGR